MGEELAFRRLAEALDVARTTSSRNAKVAAIAQALEAAGGSAATLRMAVRVCLGDLARLGIGWRALSGALAARLGETDDQKLSEATRRLGDLGDAAEELLAARGEGSGQLAVADVAAMVEGLRSATSRARRSAILATTLSRATALETKFLVKALLGELRIGAAPGVVLLAIVKAFHASEAEVRRAHGLLADLAEVAVLAAERRLGDACVAPGRPLAFMLATPIENVKTPTDFGAFVAEEKLDGVRAQVHVHAGRVVIFARGLERVTESFPEVAEVFANVERDMVLDGEVLATLADGRPRPFQALQLRIGRKRPGEELLAAVPVRFIAFDALVDGDEVLIDRPWSERRARLEGIAREVGLVLGDVWGVADAAELDLAFDRARKNGNEGLVLKRRDAPYEAGKRGQAWLKVKKATATLDVVVTAAEQGHGGRARVISDYTFAVWSEQALVDVGKAYSGLTDAEIAELSKHFVETTIEQRGGWRRVTPDVVLEVGFDGIQRSDRHASGFSLRFPRILRIRTDKTPEECDTLETVLSLYQAQLASGHREDVAPVPEPRKKTKSAGQLSLFGDKEK